MSLTMAAIALGGPLAGLHHAHVAEHQRVRRPLAHLIGPGRVGLALHGALAAEPEAEPVRLGDGRQVAVHLGRALGAAGHGGDHERRRSVLPSRVVLVSIASTLKSGSDW